ncbi:MAG: hypothetical protein ACXVB9_01920 [Bdellovibrionota bacterium]
MRKKSNRGATEKNGPGDDEFKLSEDPFLLDDPGGSPLEWIEINVKYLHAPVRRRAAFDPWERTDHAAENDALTERRRRKLQSLSLSVDDEVCDERGESVA